MTPIGTLISTRLADLGIRRPELAARLGYRNLSKGMRHIDKLMQGEFDGRERHLRTLPAVLELDDSIVAEAIEGTRAEAHKIRQAALDAAEERWRADFKPHVIVLTERTVPSQITICAFVRGERNRWIDVDASAPRETFVQQARRELESRQRRWGRFDVPFFGAPTGFVVNFSPDKAVRYSLTGKAEQILAKAFRVGEAWVLLKGRTVYPGRAADISGAVDWLELPRS